MIKNANAFSMNIGITKICPKPPCVRSSPAKTHNASMQFPLGQRVLQRLLVRCPANILAQVNWSQKFYQFAWIFSGKRQSNRCETVTATGAAAMHMSVNIRSDQVTYVNCHDHSYYHSLSFSPVRGLTNVSQHLCPQLPVMFKTIIVGITELPCALQASVKSAWSWSGVGTLT